MSHRLMTLRILTAGEVQKFSTFPVEKLIQAMDSTLPKNIHIHKSSHAVSGSSWAPRSPSTMPPQVLTTPLQPTSWVCPTAETPNSLPPGRLVRNSITEYNKPPKLQPGVTYPPISASSEFSKVYASVNIQSQVIPPRLSQVVVEIRIEVMCILEIEIASVFMEWGGDHEQDNI